MTERIGFSRLGALFLLALTVPNLFWTSRKPRGYDPSREDRRLTLLERAGQVWVTCGALLSRDISPGPWSPWSWWLAGAAALMLLYEGWWVHYFRSPRTMADYWVFPWQGPACRWRRFSCWGYTAGSGGCCLES
nr:hypothetical protein [uncultured Oscillibacter sp.]